MLGSHLINERGLVPSSFLISHILSKSGLEAWNKHGMCANHLASEGFLVFVFKPNRNNYIEIETALDLTKYLAEEDEIIVWHAVLVNLLPRNFVSDVNNYDIYPLLKVISFFVMWFKRTHSSSFYTPKSTCETGLFRSNSLLY